MISLEYLQMKRSNKAFKTAEDVKESYKSLENATKEQFINYADSKRNAINYAKEKILD
jgi:hypothetical protein